LNYLAENFNILHRDIKPANILIKDEDFIHAKICDFGCAGIIKEENHQLNSSMTLMKGTPQYWTPEQKSAMQENFSKTNSHQPNKARDSFQVEDPRKIDQFSLAVLIIKIALNREINNDPLVRSDFRNVNSDREALSRMIDQTKKKVPDFLKTWLDSIRIIFRSSLSRSRVSDGRATDV
jgi:serine/threonine protein kinase